MAAPINNKPVFKWRIRRLTEKESLSPEISASVRKLFSGLSGIQTISVVKDSDPIYIEWSGVVSGKKSEGPDNDSGYLDDEGYFDVRVTPPVVDEQRDKVIQITFSNGSVLFFTESGYVFLLSMKKMYRLI